MAFTDLTDYLYSMLEQLKGLFFHHRHCSGQCRTSGRLVDIESARNLTPTIVSQAVSNSSSGDDELTSDSESDVGDEEQEEGVVEETVFEAATNDGGDSKLHSAVRSHEQMEEIDLEEDVDEIRSEDPEESEESLSYRERYRDEVIMMSSKESSSGEDSSSYDSDDDDHQASGFWSTVNSRVWSIFSSNGRSGDEHQLQRSKVADVQGDLV